MKRNIKIIFFLGPLLLAISSVAGFEDEVRKDTVGVIELRQGLRTEIGGKFYLNQDALNVLADSDRLIRWVREPDLIHWKEYREGKPEGLFNEKDIYLMGKIYLEGLAEKPLPIHVYGFDGIKKPYSLLNIESADSVNFSLRKAGVHKGKDWICRQAAADRGLLRKYMRAQEIVMWFSAEVWYWNASEKKPEMKETQPVRLLLDDEEYDCSIYTILSSFSRHTQKDDPLYQFLDKEAMLGYGDINYYALKSEELTVDKLYKNQFKILNEMKSTKKMQPLQVSLLREAMKRALEISALQPAHVTYDFDTRTHDSLAMTINAKYAFPEGEFIEMLFGSDHPLTHRKPSRRFYIKKGPSVSQAEKDSQRIGAIPPIEQISGWKEVQRLIRGVRQGKPELLVGQKKVIDELPISLDRAERGQMMIDSLVETEEKAQGTGEFSEELARVFKEILKSSEIAKEIMNLPEVSKAQQKNDDLGKTIVVRTAERQMHLIVPLEARFGKVVVPADSSLTYVINF